MFSYGPSHMAELKQGDQLKPTYSSSVRIRDIALRTCQKWWTTERSGEKGSGISMLVPRQDDDDDGSNENEGVLHTPQISLTKTSPSMDTVSIFQTSLTELSTYVRSLQKEIFCYLSLLMLWAIVNIYIDDILYGQRVVRPYYLHSSIYTTCGPKLWNKF